MSNSLFENGVAPNTSLCYGIQTPGAAPPVTVSNLHPIVNPTAAAVTLAYEFDYDIAVKTGVTRATISIPSSTFPAAFVKYATFPAKTLIVPTTAGSQPPISPASSFVDDSTGSSGGSTSAATPASTSKPRTTSSASATRPAFEQESATGLYSCHSKTESITLNCLPTTAPKAPSTNGLKAGLGVLAALFILALAFIGFLIFRHRRRNASRPAVVNDPNLIYTADSEKTRHLEAQLAAAQASLLAASASRITPIDDRTVGSQMDQLAQEIKDWTLTHFRRLPDPNEFSPEIQALLAANVPNYEALLAVAKTRGLVVRAVIAAVLSRAWDEGDLFPGGRDVRAVERGMRKSLSPPEFNAWRSSTYGPISASFKSPADLLPALELLAARIDVILAPFADSNDGTERSKNLYRILNTFATLFLSLLAQPASFRLHMPTGRQTFDCERMEDVLQEHETKVSASGAQNELDGKAVRAIVVPGVIKRGNGEGGVDGDWESETVVAKTRVLV